LSEDGEHFSKSTELIDAKLKTYTDFVECLNDYAPAFWTFTPNNPIDERDNVWATVITEFRDLAFFDNFRDDVFDYEND